MTNLPGRLSNIRAQIIYGLEAPDPVEALLLPLRNLVSQGKLDAAAAEVRRLEALPLRTRTGRPLGSYAAGCLLSPFEGDDIARYERLIPFYAEWASRRTDCALAMTCHAMALAYTGFAYRGTDIARNVTETGWSALRRYTEQAEAVFAAANPTLMDHPYAQRAHLQLALMSGQAVEVHFERFYRAVDTAPTDMTLYQIMTHHLLPRWFGSMDMIGAMASWSADATQGWMGQTAYAAAFSEMENWEDGYLPWFDWDRVKQGYRDWRTLCSDDYVLTELAAHAYDVEDLETCLDTLENVEEIHLQAWISETSWELANSVCREFVRR